MPLAVKISKIGEEHLNGYFRGLAKSYRLIVRDTRCERVSNKMVSWFKDEFAENLSSEDGAAKREAASKGGYYLILKEGL